jgi:hypothetical protein
MLNTLFVMNLITLFYNKQMSAVKQIERGSLDLATVLSPESLEPLFDPLLARDPSPEANLELRGWIPSLPVIEETRPGRIKETYIPVYDHQTPRSLYMCLLVSRSKLFEGLFVIEFCPHPAETKQPTRIGSLFGSKNIYPPITGFLVEKQRFGLSEIALLTESQDSSSPGFERLTMKQSRGTMAGLVLNACKRAEQKNDTRLEHIRKTKVL